MSEMKERIAGQNSSLGDEIVGRINELAAISETPEHLARIFLTKEHRAAADLIACKDTRVTRRLLDHYGISTQLTPYHEHNAAAARPKLLARLGEGQAVALVSDAGTPLVSDPGFKLVREAREAGHAVLAAPGPSAALCLNVGGAHGRYLLPRESSGRMRQHSPRA